MGGWGACEKELEWVGSQGDGIGWVGGGRRRRPGEAQGSLRWFVRDGWVRGGEDGEGGSASGPKNV